MTQPNMQELPLSYAQLEWYAEVKYNAGKMTWKAGPFARRSEAEAQAARARKLLNGEARVYREPVTDPLGA